jgi:putative phage-type endonuclease
MNKERGHTLGGSDAAPAIGVSPWKTPLQLYEEKLGLASPQPETPAMRWGKLLEDAIRVHYCALTGATLREPNGTLIHPHFGWMSANLDGLTEGGRVLEIKTARSGDDWGEPGTDQIPTYYVPQVMHYLAVTRAQYVDVAALIAGHDFRLYTLERDEELIDALIEAEQDFWAHIMSCTPPDPVDLADVNRRWRRDAGSSIEATEPVLFAVRELAAAKNRTLRAQEEEERLEFDIKKFMGEAAQLTYHNRTLVQWKSNKNRLPVDWSALKRDHPELIAQYQLPEAPGNRPFLLKETPA